MENREYTELLGQIEQVKDITNKHNIFDYDFQLEKIKANLNNGEYLVSFMGQFSAGKSRLINNLLRRDLLPVHITETTAMITFIKYGSEEKAVLYYEGVLQTPALTSMKKRLA